MHLPVISTYSLIAISIIQISIGPIILPELIKQLIFVLLIRPETDKIIFSVKKKKMKGRRTMAD